MATSIKLFFLCFIIEMIASQPFSIFKQEMENTIKQIAQQMKTIFQQQRCSTDVTQCIKKSYNFCEGTSEMYCNQNFPQSASCQTSGAHVSTNSSIRFPLETDVNNLPPEERQFVCASALLEEHFQSLDEQRNQKYTIAYVGSQYGSFRQYPTATQDQEFGQCINYDPRLRPWYVTATTGPKNLIIMLDISGFMELKLTQFKRAAKTIIQSLSSVDFVGVVAFSNVSTPLGTSRIQRATSERKKFLEEQIDKLVARGQTNFQLAFTTAIQMLENATNDEYGSPCIDSESILLFFSDGRDNSQTSTQLIQSINTKRKTIPLRIFAFSIGNQFDSDAIFLKDLACAFGGISFNSQDISDLIDSMEGYYQYISVGANITEPIWSEPYQDAFGFGMLFTVSVPIIYEGTDFKKVIGVAGLDILYSKMLSFGFDEIQVISRLISNKCPVESLSECQLESYRGTETCGVEGCTGSYSIPECGDRQTQDIFASGVTSKIGYCCPVGSTDDDEEQEKSNSWIVGVVLGVLCGFGIGIGCYFLYKKYKSQNQEGREQKYKQPTNHGSNEEMPRTTRSLERLANSPVQLPKCDQQYLSL